MALTHRRAAPGMHRSDRGTQYPSAAYQQQLTAVGCTASRSRVGDCWDNAVAESFFATPIEKLLGDTPLLRGPPLAGPYLSLLKCATISSVGTGRSAIARRWTTKTT
jgi:transposase InsO family protein